MRRSGAPVERSVPNLAPLEQEAASLNGPVGWAKAARISIKIHCARSAVPTRSLLRQPYTLFLPRGHGGIRSLPSRNASAAPRPSRGHALPTLRCLDVIGTCAKRTRTAHPLL